MMKKAILLLMIVGLMASCGNDGPKKVKLDAGEKVTTSYANGTPQVVRTFEDEDGKLVAVYEKEYYEDGNLLKEGAVAENNRHGQWKTYYRNGNVKSDGSYVYGVSNDSIKGYYPDGTLKFTGVFENGQKTATWLYYDEKGNLVENKVFMQPGEQREGTIVLPKD